MSKLPSKLKQLAIFATSFLVCLIGAAIVGPM